MTVFTVPETHDMVSQLLSPKHPKNLTDVIVIGILAAHVSFLFIFPKSISIPLYAVLFTFWRFGYNGGIGFLLREQSLYNSIVNWAKKTGVFEKPSTGKNTKPHLYPSLKKELETKIPKDYSFEDAPLEYNVWLLFRRLCDLILLCDFVSYCCFAAACGGTPDGEFFGVTAARWAVGIGLILFNLWVKLDAHRVVKDYAWYWGDFFFLIDQELTFDGVFEMAPHPMYSVGYAGFYGISLMAASYKVLFISIFAHAAQFAFLTIVENPHIEKIYNPPPPRKHLSEDRGNEPDLSSIREADPNAAETNGLARTNSNSAPSTEPPHIRDIIGIENLDLYRVIDISAILLQFYIYTFAILTPSTSVYQIFFLANAAFWRFWYSIGIGYLLDRQSKKKKWTRHFIKYGETTEEAWRQWKGVYHLSMTMCYASFAVAAYKMYSLPPDWEYGASLLRHVLGTALIVLQLWTQFSMYESLGEFNWFFGDFFFDQGPKLTYSGIYRFLNNPERIIGLAGVWGAGIMTWSKSIFLLALLSHGLSLCFIQFVERPHMQKRYGQRLRGDSGVSKTFKSSLPSPLKKWQENMDKTFEDAVDWIEEIVDSTAPKLANNYDHLVKHTKTFVKDYPARVSFTRIAPDMADFDTKDYSIEVEGTVSSNQASVDKISGREGDMAQAKAFRGAQFQPSILEYGAPIKVRWTGPLNHSKKDWIGLYMLADNSSRDVTRISSQGRWIATSQGAYDSARPDQGQLVSDKQTIRWSKDGKGSPLMTGEVEFSGDKLWWTTGVFEFRYHHDGMHNVMAISEPFEIRISRFDEDDVEPDVNGSVRSAVEQTLLPVVQNCFDRDPEIAPNAPDEAFGGLVEREGKFAKRVVFAIWQM